MTTQLKIVNSKETKTFKLNENLKLDKKQHTQLVKYLKARLTFAKVQQEIERYKSIDREVAGYMVLDADDKLRKLDNDKGYGPKVYDVNLPLTATQMDEAVTFFTTVFFPEEGPYNAVTTKDKQETAKGFSALMNQHSAYFKHFQHFAKGAYDGLKYNQGMWLIEWEEEKGTIVGNDDAGLLNIQDDQLVMQGNKMERLDIYNTLLDPSVPPTELHKRGEFFAIVEAITIFQSRRMAERGEIFNLSALFDSEGNNVSGSGQFETTYFEKHPILHGDNAHTDDNRKIDWFAFLSGTQSTELMRALEFVTIYIWLPSKRLNLNQSDKYQIWRIVLADNHVVVSAELMTNAHGYLPFIAIEPWDDGLNSTSYGEMLLPYQRFASFQMNIHQRASRKALYNLTIYNERILPQLKDADVLGGKVPFTGPPDLDVRKLLAQFSDVPDTSNTLTDIQNMDVLMQKILPTDILKQVAGLERATQYQAAATVQGANRRNLKIAKLIDSQAFSVGRKLQMYNILQFQQAIEIITPEGDVAEIDPSELRDAKFEFAISDSLRGMDKLILIETMKDVLNVLIQNPQAAQTFDVAEIVNYITTLIGDHTSFAQFKFDNEFDKLTPEQKQQAFELLQSALTAQAQEQQTARTT